MFNVYLVDSSLTDSEPRHYLGRKILYNYENYSLQAKKQFDSLTNCCFWVEEVMNHLRESITNRMLKTSGISQERFLLSNIVSDICRSVLEANIVLSSTNKSSVVSLLARQVIEFFTVLRTIIKAPEEYYSLYMNHANILEYKALRDYKARDIDEDLVKIYEVCISLFATLHDLNEEDASKIYAQPNGWAYGIYIDKLGKPYKRISSKMIRDSVFSEVLPKNKEQICRLIKTFDLISHANSGYLVYMRDIDTGNESFREATIRLMLSIFEIAINDFCMFLRKDSPEHRVLINICKRIHALETDKLCEAITMISNYDEISSISKNPSSFDSLENFLSGSIDFKKGKARKRISHYDFLHHSFFSMSDYHERVYIELDNLYTLLDVVFNNFNDFVMPKLNITSKTVNFSLNLWIIDYFYQNIEIAFMFGAKALLQKTLRLVFEYVAVQHLLSKSDELVNEAFFKHAYLVIENTILNETLAPEDTEAIFNEIKELLDFNDSITIDKLKYFTGWTYSGKSKLSITDIVKVMLNDIDDSQGALKTIWIEINTATHGNNFVYSNNNDINAYDDTLLDYVNAMYSLVSLLIKDYHSLVEPYKDSKLSQSVAFAHVLLNKNLVQFNKDCLDFIEVKDSVRAEIIKRYDEYHK